MIAELRCLLHDECCPEEHSSQENPERVDHRGQQAALPAMWQMPPSQEKGGGQSCMLGAVRHRDAQLPMTHCPAKQRS